MSLFGIWFWLTVGNLLYQALGHRVWADAFDRSWWEGWALLTVWIAAKMRVLMIGRTK